MLAASGELAVRGDASERGVIRCEVANGAGLTQDARSWLGGVTDFLVAGLRDVASDYPDEVQLVVTKETGR